jgi:hypothetical protein
MPATVDGYLSTTEAAISAGYRSVGDSPVVRQIVGWVRCLAGARDRAGAQEHCSLSPSSTGVLLALPFAGSVAA